jgi:probable HAF family extracellular repeat protein
MTVQFRTQAVRVLFTLGLVVVFQGVASSIGPYHITNLGAIAEYGSAAHGINAIGQVTGNSDGNHPSKIPFLWQPTRANGKRGDMLQLGTFGIETVPGMGFDLNAAGEVVGYLGARAFLWKPTTPNATSGTLVALDNLLGDAGLSEARAINNAGQIVGWSYGATGEHAVLWQPSPSNSTEYTIVDLIPGREHLSGIGGINSVGQIVGSISTETGSSAFLWQPSTPNGTAGAVVRLGHLAGSVELSGAGDVNDAGQVVGASSIGYGGQHAFLWQPSIPNGTVGTMIDLGDLPGGREYSGANAINSSGQIVGSGCVGDATSVLNFRAVLWIGSSMIVDLNNYLDTASRDGWTLLQASDINDAGQIVGYGVHNGSYRGFLLTPIPEPMSLTLIWLGVAVFSIFRRRAPWSVLK